MKQYPLVTMDELLVALTQVSVQENGVALLATTPGDTPAMPSLPDAEAMLRR